MRRGHSLIAQVNGQRRQPKSLKGDDNYIDTVSEAGLLFLRIQMAPVEQSNRTSRAEC